LGSNWLKFHFNAHLEHIFRQGQQITTKQAAQLITWLDEFVTQLRTLQETIFQKKADKSFKNYSKFKR
jgi:hypothetical protein